MATLLNASLDITKVEEIKRYIQSDVLEHGLTCIAPHSSYTESGNAPVTFETYLGTFNCDRAHALLAQTDISIESLLYTALAWVVRKFSAQDKALVMISNTHENQALDAFSVFNFQHIQDVKCVDTELQSLNVRPSISLVEIEKLKSTQTVFNPVFLTIGQVQTDLSRLLDLTISIALTSESPKLTLTYNPSVFSANYIKIICRSIDHIIGYMLDAGNLDLSAVPAHPEDLRQALEQTQMAVNTQPPRIPLLHRWFEEVATNTPDLTALVCENTRLTYFEVNFSANQLARHLIAKGIKQGDVVSICMERNQHSIIAMLAILKAGATYLPLDPSYPNARLQHIFGDAHIRLLLTDSKHEEKLHLLTQIDRLSLDIELTKNEVLENSGTNLSVNIAEDSKAYVIYTSGSTGKPKGVPQSHINLTQLIDQTRSTLKFNEHDVWATTNSFSFDFSVWEIWGALLNGATLVIPSTKCIKNPSSFADFCHQHQVTVLNQTPSYFKVFIEAIEQQTHTPTLRLVILGGEEVDERTVNRWHALNTGADLINTYGITEVTVICTLFPLNANFRDSRAIGTPINGQAVYLLDSELRPVPPGEIGELCVSGRLSSGYINLPDQTKERFVDNPFLVDGEQGQLSKLYRSGDLAIIDDSGECLFLGRKDNQVKIRGFRIEISEIEEQLRQISNVKDTLVTTKKADDHDVQLVANILKDNKTPDLKDTDLISAIKDTIEQVLPSYMQPTLISIVAEWPRTINGKIDVSSLPKPVPLTRNTNDTQQEPSSPTEKKLANIWTELLNVEPNHLSKTSNFFELGGHSLLLTKLIASIYDEFKIEIDYAELFSAKNLTEIASIIDCNYIEL